MIKLRKRKGTLEKAKNYLYRYRLTMIDGSLWEMNERLIRNKVFCQKRDYLSVQDALFKGMNVDEIFEKAKEYSEGRID